MSDKDDYISRKEALKICRRYWHPTYNPIMEEIEKLPSVQPEHKTGRWMFGFNNQYLEKYYYCSNCGCRKHTEDEPSDYFCPRCGADMRGGDSNE